MANSSAKRIGSIPPSRTLVLLIISLTASQNEVAVTNMLYGHLLGNLLPLLIRILFRWQAFRQSKTAIAMYCISAALSQFLYRHLKKMGTPRRDSTGNLLSPGDDLNQPGMTEWTFDILYISCESWNRPRVPTSYIVVSAGIAQSGSAILGEWFWWIYVVVLSSLFLATASLTFYFQIPTFVIYKLWNLVSPMLLGRSSAVGEEEPRQEEGLSKRQEKLKKRSDRGDPRVKAQVRK